MKFFIANIFLFIGSRLTKLANLIIDTGLKLHIKWKTPYAQKVLKLQNEVTALIRKELENTLGKKEGNNSTFIIKPK